MDHAHLEKHQEIPSKVWDEAYAKACNQCAQLIRAKPPHEAFWAYNLVHLNKDFEGILFYPEGVRDILLKRDFGVFAEYREKLEGTQARSFGHEKKLLLEYIDSLERIYQSYFLAPVHFELEGGFKEKPALDSGFDCLSAICFKFSNEKSSAMLFGVSPRLLQDQSDPVHYIDHKIAKLKAKPVFSEAVNDAAISAMEVIKKGLARKRGEHSEDAKPEYTEDERIFILSKRYQALKKKMPIVNDDWSASGFLYDFSIIERTSWLRILAIKPKSIERQREKMDKIIADPDTRKIWGECFDELLSMQYDYNISHTREKFNNGPAENQKTADFYFELLESISSLFTHEPLHATFGLTKRQLKNLDDPAGAIDGKITELRKTPFISDEVTQLTLKVMVGLKEAVLQLQQQHPGTNGLRVPKIRLRLDEIEGPITRGLTAIARQEEKYPGANVMPLEQGLRRLGKWKRENNLADETKFPDLTLAKLFRVEKPEIEVMHEVLRLRSKIGGFDDVKKAEFDEIVDAIYDGLIAAYYPVDSSKKMALAGQYERAVNAIVPFFNANRTDGQRMVIPENNRSMMVAAKTNIFDTPRPLPWIALNEEQFGQKMAMLGEKAKACGVVQSGRLYAASGDDSIVRQSTNQEWLRLMLQLRVAHRQIQRHLVLATGQSAATQR